MLCRPFPFLVKLGDAPVAGLPERANVEAFNHRLVE